MMRFFSSYAESLIKNGMSEEAFNFANKAMEIIKEIQAGDPNNKEAKFDIAANYELFAKIHRYSNDLEKVAENYKKALAICEETFTADAKNIESFNLMKRFLTSQIKIYDKMDKSVE